MTSFSAKFYWPIYRFLLKRECLGVITNVMESSYRISFKINAYRLPAQLWRSLYYFKVEVDRKSIRKTHPCAWKVPFHFCLVLWRNSRLKCQTPVAQFNILTYNWIIYGSPQSKTQLNPNIISTTVYYMYLYTQYSIGSEILWRTNFIILT